MTLLKVRFDVKRHALNVIVEQALLNGIGVVESKARDNPDRTIMVFLGR